jgi:hypothetical protein
MHGRGHDGGNAATPAHAADVSHAAAISYDAVVNRAATASPTPPARSGRSSARSRQLCAGGDASDLRVLPPLKIPVTRGDAKVARMERNHPGHALRRCNRLAAKKATCRQREWHFRADGKGRRQSALPSCPKQRAEGAHLDELYLPGGQLDAATQGGGAAGVFVAAGHERDHHHLKPHAPGGRHPLRRHLGPTTERSAFTMHSRSRSAASSTV